jgi:hypothetical protein
LGPSFRHRDPITLRCRSCEDTAGGSGRASQFAHVVGQLPDGTTVPLFWLRYVGSAIT